MGMLVLVAGAALWAVLVAVVYCVLGVVGRACRITTSPTPSARLLLGTAIVCVAALTRDTHRTELDTCQPRCDLRHSPWLP